MIVKLNYFCSDINYVKFYTYKWRVLNIFGESQIWKHRNTLYNILYKSIYAKQIT